MKRAWFSLTVLLTLGFAHSAAHADEPAGEPAVAQDERAAALKRTGDEAMEALRFADALAAYAAADAIRPNPALLYNMGRALQALNRFPEALAKLEEFEAKAPPELKQRVPRLAALIQEIRARVSALTIRTNVDGARILVRSTVMGRSPLSAPLALPSGPAEIEVDAEGYYPSKQVVDLPGGGALVVDAKLLSRDVTGLLSVRASAAGAEVLVDGRRVGVAPVDALVPSGAHQIRVRHPDFRDYESSTVVPAGAQRTLSVTLAPPSIFSRWWFWGGVGAVAAAGAVVTIALVSERPADNGTIAPGQLSAPSALGGRGVTVLEFR